jgi:aspartate aminotransferase
MIAERMKELIRGSSVIRAMFEEGKKMAALHGMENVYDFSLGNPSVEPPRAVKKAILEILDEEDPNFIHGYMNNSGYEGVRETLAKEINEKQGTQFRGEDLLMTTGAAGALNVVLKTLLDPGDEVLAFAPYFGEYGNYVANYDGKLVVVPADTERFQLKLEEAEKRLTAKTKAVIINSPNNPSGAVYSEKTIRQLAALLEEKQKAFGHEIYLISDEPYREVTYDGTTVPYVTRFYDNTFVAYSFSKALSLPGERIGYLAVSPMMAEKEKTIAGLNVANRILGFVNAPSLFQLVIARCADAAVDVSIYKRNRDMLYKNLTALGFSCLEPKGAFYMFPEALEKDDKAFCEKAKEFNLLLVPGSAFACPGFFRLAYCVDEDKVKRSLTAFEKLARAYGKA